MRALGIEFAGDKLRYVLVVDGEDGTHVEARNVLTLGGTRDPLALRAFHAAVVTMMNATAPDLIAIKEKPEKGQLKAGAAALKMEGIALAVSRVPVDFVSGARVNAIAEGAGLNNNQQPAYRAAISALKKVAA